jgi:hypothetical protein
MLADVIVPETDDATYQIRQDSSGNTARLGATGHNEIGDRHRNKKSP